MELLSIQFALPAFGLVLARVAGLVMAVPMLTSLQIPRHVKLWLVVTLALMVFQTVRPSLPEGLGMAQAATGMVGEFVIGLVVGLGAGFALLAAQIAGNIVSHQSGLTLGVVFNPMFDTESTVLDQIWFFGTMMIFLALHGHVAVFEVLLRSFTTVPPLSMSARPELAEFFAGMLAAMFETAMRLAGPAILALLISSLVLGFLTKTMPQMNLLSVGFSLKVAVAIFVAALTMGLSEDLIVDSIFSGLDPVGDLFSLISREVKHAV